MSLLLLFTGAPKIVVIVPSLGPSGGGGGLSGKELRKHVEATLRRKQIAKEDQDILDLIVIIIKSGILE